MNRHWPLGLNSDATYPGRSALSRTGSITGYVIAPRGSTQLSTYAPSVPYHNSIRQRGEDAINLFHVPTRAISKGPET